MDLKMEVYTPFLELVGLLEIQRSVIWEEKAFSAGSFSVESLITDESRELLVPDNIIWIEGESAGIIEYVNQESDETGPYISVKGRTLTGILDRRALLGQYNMSGTVPAIMRRLVDDCCVHPTRGNVEARKIPCLALADIPAGGTSIRVQKTGGSLLEALEELGEAYQAAFGVRFNPSVPQMEFWVNPGVDRSVNQTANDPVFYSTELDDVLSSEYSYDSGNYRNVAFVAGEGEGKDRVMITIEDLVDPAPEPPAPGTYTISLSVDPQGGGTVAGGGSFEDGSSVTVTASPSSGYEFIGWRESGSIVSGSASYTFTATTDRSLTAVFAAISSGYVVSVSVDPSGSGTVTGSGTYQEGESVTVTAAAVNGYRFVSWKEGGTTVSTSTSYTFTANGNRTLVAMFEAISAGRLPAGYTEVEYVQNGTGSTISFMPYIQMPAKADATKFAIKFSSGQASISSNSTVYAVYGYTTGSGSSIYRYGVSLVSGKVRYRYGGGTTWVNLTDYTANAIYEIELDSVAKTVTTNGEVKSKTVGTMWRTSNNRLFGQQNNLNDESQAKTTKVYSVKMWGSDGNLVLDFVPCVDPSGTIGMYDVIGGQFYGNSNTSTSSSNKFIAGPSV